MKLKLHYLILFFSCQFVSAQTEKIINGKVLFNGFPISNAEIINSNSKKTTTSDAEGNFSIEVILNDILVFITKSYELKKLHITPLTLEEGAIKISLNLKPEELSEVIITNRASIKLSNDKKWEQQKLDDYKLEKTPRGAQSVDFNSSQIPNGPDLIRIVGMISSLFTKEKEPPKEILPKIKFKALAESLLDQKYYHENLKLKEDEINLFLQYCEADPKSYQVIQDNNVLSMIDFLSLKILEFRKL